MKSNTKKFSLLIVALLISFNSVAEPKRLALQLAVIKHAAGSKEIMKGEYGQGLQKLVKASARKRALFDIATGICAAKIMTNDLEQAIPFCSQAIDMYKERRNSKYHYLTSIAYSNRGIVRFKLGDMAGALEDIETAVSIDNNNIVLSNLDYLKSRLSANQQETLQVASD